MSTANPNWEPQTYLCYSYTMYEGKELRHRVGGGRSMADIDREIAEYKKAMGETLGGLIPPSKTKILRYEIWHCPGWVMIK